MATIDLYLKQAANVTDAEGETLPTETDKRNEYRDTINPKLEEIRKQKRKEFQEKVYQILPPDEDVDIIGGTWQNLSCFQGPEKNSDASWYTSIGAEIVSGVLKTVGLSDLLVQLLIDLRTTQTK